MWHTKQRGVAGKTAATQESKPLTVIAETECCRRPRDSPLHRNARLRGVLLRAPSGVQHRRARRPSLHHDLRLRGVLQVSAVMQRGRLGWPLLLGGLWCLLRPFTAPLQRRQLRNCLLRVTAAGRRLMCARAWRWQRQWAACSLAGTEPCDAMLCTMRRRGTFENNGSCHRSICLDCR